MDTLQNYDEPLNQEWTKSIWEEVSLFISIKPFPKKREEKSGYFVLMEN